MNDPVLVCGSERLGDVAIQLRVARTIDLSHAPGPRGERMSYSPKRVPGVKATMMGSYFCSMVCQLVTTVIGAGCASSAVCTTARNFVPSREI